MTDGFYMGRWDAVKLMSAAQESTNFSKTVQGFEDSGKKFRDKIRR